MEPLPPPRIPEGARFPWRVRLRTRWSDEDNQNVLNNAVYMTLLEEARYAYCKQNDLLEDNQFTFVLAQSNIRFLRPGKGGVEVDVEVETTHLGRSSLIQVYRVSEASSGEVWCEAEAALVGYDSEARRKMPLSERFKETVRRVEGMSGASRE